MKLASQEKKTPESPPSRCTQGELFLNHIVKQLGGRKAFAYDMHLSRTMINAWLNGTKPNPLDRTRRMCEIARSHKRRDLIGAMFTYLTGGFDCAVLSDKQMEALGTLAEILK